MKKIRLMIFLLPLASCAEQEAKKDVELINIDPSKNNNKLLLPEMVSEIKYFGLDTSKSIFFRNLILQK